VLTQIGRANTVGDRDTIPLPDIVSAGCVEPAMALKLALDALFQAVGLERCVDSAEDGGWALASTALTALRGPVGRSRSFRSRHLRRERSRCRLGANANEPANAADVAPVPAYALLGGRLDIRPQKYLALAHASLFTFTACRHGAEAAGASPS
jgi:hypothetical protein